MKGVANGEEFGKVGFAHPSEGNAGPLGDDVLHVLLANIDDDFVPFLAPSGQIGLQFGGGFLFAVAQGGGPLEILGLDGGFLFHPDGLDLGLGGLEFRRAEAGGDSATGAGLVHDIDGLVWQVTTSDVAFAEANRGGNGLVGNLGVMMLLVFPAQAPKDGDGLVDGGGVNPDGLKTALEGGVLLDVFAVLVHGGGTDALEFAAGEGGLDDIGGIHGTFGGAGPHEGVELIDEKNDGLQFPNFLHDGFDALLKLAAVFGAGDHEGEIEGDDLLITKNFRDIA